MRLSEVVAVCERHNQISFIEDFLLHNKKFNDYAASLSRRSVNNLRLGLGVKEHEDAYTPLAVRLYDEGVRI